MEDMYQGDRGIPDVRGKQWWQAMLVGAAIALGAVVFWVQISGEIVYHKKFEGTRFVSDPIHLEPGLYTVEVRSALVLFPRFRLRTHSQLKSLESRPTAVRALWTSFWWVWPMPLFVTSTMTAPS